MLSGKPAHGHTGQYLAARGVAPVVIHSSLCAFLGVVTIYAQVFAQHSLSAGSSIYPQTAEAWRGKVFTSFLLSRLQEMMNSRCHAICASIRSLPFRGQVVAARCQQPDSALRTWRPRQWVCIEFGSNRCEPELLVLCFDSSRV